jgi:hypothetical protein
MFVAPAIAQVVNGDLWVTDGPVNAIVLEGNTIYIGGDFRTVGPATGGGVILDPLTGMVIPQSPKVAGQVFAAVSDGSGGWYIGGDFKVVGGVPRTNLAHIEPNSTCQVISRWSADRPVTELPRST